MPLLHQPDRQPSKRAKLLASCACTTVLAGPTAAALILLSGTSTEARADDCAPQGGIGCSYIVQYPPAPNGQNNGSSGSPGIAVSPAQVNIPGALYSTPTSIAIGTFGQQGGEGRNSHYSELGENGGDGGAGGSGNTLTVTMQPGTTTRGATVTQANGSDGGVAGQGSHQTAETLADWLQQRPGVAVIARDRSTEYARGIALGAPDAVQVCDRWHLLANMRQAVERWLHGAHARLQRLPMPPAGTEEATPVLVRRDRAFRRSGPERAASAASRARRRARYNDVRRRHLAGESLLAIARATGLARATVRKYARAESFPEWAAHRPRRSILDPYLPYLERRLAEGCENGVVLWRELCAQGFPSGAKQVHRWLAERRTTPAKSRRRVRGPNDVRRPTARDTGPALPMPRQLAWSLVQPVAALGAAETAAVAHVEQDEEARTVVGLARRFTALVRACGVQSRQGSQIPAKPTAELDTWLAEARACGVSTIETFAAGLETDAAVRAALTHPWSSGQGEGQVNRLKLLKRQSYGRAGFDLLRRRVLLAA